MKITINNRKTLRLTRVPTAAKTNADVMVGPQKRIKMSPSPEVKAANKAMQQTRDSVVRC